MTAAIRRGLAVLAEESRDDGVTATAVARRLLPRTTWSIAICRDAENHEAALEWAFLAAVTVDDPLEEDVEAADILAPVLMARDRSDIVKYALSRVSAPAGAGVGEAGSLSSVRRDKIRDILLAAARL
jgi:hypothetical protein